MSITDDIKQRLDLVELITTSGTALRKAGRNWTGFCPFHSNTRTPAFFVFPDTQSYYCFGCQASGDAFNFLMARQGLDFTGALEQLASRAGVELQPHTPEREQEQHRAAVLRQINEDAAVYWHHLLRRSQRGAPGREYTAKRGLDEQALEAWQIGYAPEDWTSLLGYLTDRKNHAPDDIEAAGLVIRRENGGYYDRFRQRLMFPIRNHKGVIVGFGGRTLGNDQAKYMNTPETPSFHKGQLLFGLYEGREAIRQADEVVLVEGYLDVITAHQAGFRNVVAPMGTSLTSDQASVLKRLTRHITLALDADAAGNAATLKDLHLLRDELATTTTAVGTPQGLIRWERELDGVLKVAELPPGHDPDMVIRVDPQRWRNMVAQAIPLVEFYLQVFTATLDLDSAKGKAAAIERLAPVIAALSNEVERAHYIQKLAKRTALPDLTISNAVAAARRGKALPITLPTEPAMTSTLHARENELLSLLLRYPVVQPSVEAALHGELAKFPALSQALRGDISEAVQGTENRLLWQAWQDRGAVDTGAWLVSLPDALREHARHLVEWRDEPPFPEFGEAQRATQLAEKTALELRKAVVHQRRHQVKAMYEAVDDPAERQGLLTQLLALNSYQAAVTAPRRSTYFQDLGTRLDGGSSG